MLLLKRTVRKSRPFVTVPLTILLATSMSAVTHAKSERAEAESRKATVADKTDDAAAATRKAVNEHEPGEKRAESETVYHTGKTAEDQSLKPKDVELTRSIRRDLMNKDELSMEAKNVKIITENGKVTLKGSVDNANERKIIREAAQARAGKTKVDDQLNAGKGEDLDAMKEE